MRTFLDIIFNPGEWYWELSQEQYDTIKDAFGDEADFLGQFEKIGDTWYADKNVVDSDWAAELESLNLIGRFDYKKSTQSTLPF